MWGTNSKNEENYKTKQKTTSLRLCRGEMGLKNLDPQKLRLEPLLNIILIKIIILIIYNFILK